MGTSCALVRVVKNHDESDFVLEGVRVNLDGYPEWMRNVLNEGDWLTPNCLDVLFSKGEIRSLSSNLDESEWYGNSQSFGGASLSEIKKEAGADYVYFYYEELKCWI
ncbi:MAG: hypothetical protein U9R37_02385 [Campylobacterota bacterium]|nr:hypothetical protein [Campylobacterota bacterium]